MNSKIDRLFYLAKSIWPSAYSPAIEVKQQRTKPTTYRVELCMDEVWGRDANPQAVHETFDGAIDLIINKLEASALKLKSDLAKRAAHIEHTVVGKGYDKRSS